MKVMPMASGLGLLVGVVLGSVAIADPPASSCHGAISAEAGAQVFNVSAGTGGCSEAAESTKSGAVDGTLPAGHVVTSTTCGAVPGVGCVGGPRTCPDGTPMSISWFATDDGHILNLHNNCGSAPPSGPDPGPTQADILRAFQQIPLPESRLIIQPPGGATLVNFATNFYTQAAPFNRTVTLLGHQVDFTIKTQTFTWHFGDHTQTTTHRPGAAYPHLDITHRYRTKGTVTPSVDTVWQADYRIDGGAWATVDGTVTKQGPTQRLTIRTATPVLVG